MKQTDKCLICGFGINNTIHNRKEDIQFHKFKSHSQILSFPQEKIEKVRASEEELVTSGSSNTTNGKPVNAEKRRNSGASSVPYTPLTKYNRIYNLMNFQDTILLREDNVLSALNGFINDNWEDDKKYSGKEIKEFLKRWFPILNEVKIK